MGTELYLPHVVDPPQLPTAMLRVVELFEGLYATQHLLARHDVGLFRLLRPSVCLQHPDLMCHATRTTAMRELVVLLLQLVTEGHVSEHGRQLLNCLLPAFHLQLCDEGILCIDRHGQLVQQSPRECPLVEVQEYVLVLQVSEQADHLVDKLHHLFLISALQALLQLPVAEEGEVLGTTCVLVQDSLEAPVARLLKPRVIVEACRYHLVNLRLEL
mmetsp:Transcript_1698/g.3467  ORF Transcript_1698/g.3467 Transcript_1698/m.3467 type:complete len:215 (-) Transcript_1698:1197-1841(-)